MSALFSGQLDNSIVIGDGETVTIDEAVIAPVGDPAVDISGDDATLQVKRSGSVSATDAGNTAVDASGSNDTIANWGEISGDFNGISSTGDSLELENSGTISSNNRAVDLSDGDGSRVRNSGTILGTDNQRNGTLYVDGTVDHLRLTNTASGVIDAGAGNLGDAVSVQVGAEGDPGNTNINIVNNGLLQGRGDGPDVFANGARVAANGSSGLRFFNGSGNPEATITGSIRNNGTITSEVSVGFLGGLVVEDGVAFDGHIVNGNSGTIFGPNNGLYIGNANHNLKIINRGLIQSGSRAVNIDGNNVRLINRGSIFGSGDQRNGTVYSDATADKYQIVNGGSGVIDAGDGNQGAGIALQTGEVAGDVVRSSLINRGLIRGRGQAADNLGLAGDGLRVFSGVTDGETVYRGTIFNQGHILSESTQGATAAVRFSNGLAFDGRLINGSKGLIDGVQNGLYFGDAEHDATAINRGTIQSGSRAVNIDGSGVHLRNFGHILGTDDQRNGTVYSDSTADEYSIFNGSSGLINAGQGNNGAGVSLQTGDVDGDVVKASLSNKGTIRGRGNGDGNLAGDGVRLFTSVNGATFTGDLDNYGLILGSDDGIDIQAGVTLDGDIKNSGEIVAEAIGVHISGALEGTLNNSGTIAGGVAAVDATAATAGVTVNNTGDIDGNVLLSNFDDVFDSANGTVNGTIDGGGGNDLLIGDRGDNILVGGNGQDTFVFGIDSGFDTVADFSVSGDDPDRLDVSALFDDVNQILGVGGAATQVGISTLIEFGHDNAVFLINVSVNDLTADNFIV